MASKICVFFSYEISGFYKIIYFLIPNWIIKYFFILADLYAWLVVFVMPLNSAVNPLLYTFTTPKYRNQVLLRGWNKFVTRKELNKVDGSGTSNQGI